MMCVQDHFGTVQIISDLLRTNRANLRTVTTEDASFMNNPCAFIFTTDSFDRAFSDAFIAVLAIVFLSIDGLSRNHDFPPNALSSMLMIFDSSTFS
jgi:hypothetical protein